MWDFVIPFLLGSLAATGGVFLGSWLVWKSKHPPDSGAGNSSGLGS